MTSRPQRFHLPILFVSFLSLLLLPLAATADAPLATLRIESLDAALADAETIAGFFDAPMEREQMLGMALEPLGLSAGDWLDRTRPLALTLPVQGMMSGANGLVAALPVKDADGALAALQGLFADYQESGGRHTFTREDGTMLTVEVHDGYLLASVNAAMLTGFDVEAALSGAGLPPGNLVLDLRLEPVTPMLQAALEQGRQIAKQKMTTGAEGAEGDDAAFDAQSMGAMIDLYIDVLQDATRNVNRIQLAVEVTPQHGIIYNRLVPIPGSTLAGLIDAQSGGFPEIAKLVPDSGNLFGSVANIQLTPESTAAIKGYFHTYAAAVGQLLETVEEQPLTAQFGVIMTMMEPILDQWFECSRGDLAASFSFDAESGMNVTEIIGAANAETCEALMAEVVEIYDAVPANADGERWLTMTPGALTHAGVEAYRQETRFGAMPDGGEMDDEAMKAVQKMMGGDAFETYAGIQRDLMLVTGGVDAEQRFKDLADLASKTKKWKKSEGTLTEESFAPLAPGAGMFAYIDLGSFLSNIATAMDEYETDFAVLGSLPADQRRVTYGGRLADGSMTLELALPFELIRAMRLAAEHDGDHDHDEGELEHESHGDAEYDVDVEG